MGDGTGCDNMTCIIVRFNQEWLLDQKQNGSAADKTQTINSEKENKNDNDLNPSVETKPSVKRAERDENFADNGAIENNSKRIKLA